MPGSLAAAYGDAHVRPICYGNLRSALAKTDALIKAQPKNPYFHELRGDILMKAQQAEGGRGSLCQGRQPRPGEVGHAAGLLRPGADCGRQAGSLKKAVDESQQRARARQGKRQRLPLSRAGLWPAWRYPGGRSCDRRRLFLRRQLQGREDLRHARAAEDEARRAGLGAGAGHHQLQGRQEEEMNLSRRAAATKPVGTAIG